MRSSQEMAPDAEQIQHDTVNRREPLELSGGRETPHPALTLSGRLMGDLRAIVRVLIVQWRTDGITARRAAESLRSVSVISQGIAISSELKSNMLGIELGCLPVT